jgi:hypothetical protein
VKRLIVFLIAASLCLPTASSAWWKSIQQVGVGGSPPAASYSFLGIVAPSTSAVSTVITIPVTFGAAAAGRVMVFGVGIQNGQAITSIIIDPTGTPVSLTQVIADSTALTSLWSGVDTTHTGTTSVQITFATSINFNNLSVAAWQATGLGSTTSRQQNQATSTDSVTISVTSTDFLFAMDFVGGATGYDYSTSTVAPFANHQDASNFGSAADWTITSTNPSFTVTPKAGAGIIASVATWR